MMTMMMMLVMMLVMSNSMYAMLLCMGCVNSRLGVMQQSRYMSQNCTLQATTYLFATRTPLLLCQRLHTMGAILALGTINYVPCMNFHLSTYKRI